MTNSPIICQVVVAAASDPAGRQFLNALLHHYTDDTLVAAETETFLSAVTTHLRETL